ncbi:cytochrome o ubiquinol oxidase subunit IV [Pullulanibacillus sp. KACC 23026]|uniref:cytochrome o ubiquinol oxidase subunit IV n=1 Tax=Pullulanibacillus sp. KACC 23026 TaxID=3028315 RepID=UPI0023B1B478|nr:cytochrome o ubiquinol oxidase subunit IV [Pullulanibacillus sp. KACC 23026]WEG12984.1 cytochrome o ubiquinol oxidase subunit IV [Pullulanibacillus sp. KACC 23026]
MAHEHTQHAEEHSGSAGSYILGFICSIVLTLIPLWLVLGDIGSHRVQINLIMLMAVLQFLVQLFFFMHVRDSEKPRYNVVALIFGAVFVITIVLGSAWIMSFNSQVQ